MKIYIAAKFTIKEEVRKLFKLFEERGHEIHSDWTLHKTISPYEENQELARQYSIEDLSGVKESDVFILLSDENGRGMYVELGVAILSNMQRERPRIFIVGKKNNNSLFYFHPSVNRRETIGQVIEEIEKI